MTDFKPLAGVRVLDFTHVIAGPFASLYLARMGAEVTKIENADGGDVMRQGKRLKSYVALNAGKTCLSLDLKEPGDLARARVMAAQADVLLESMRPGVMQRFGLGAKDAMMANPRLIYCSISGFGHEGEWADRPAYDPIVQAVTGMAMMSGREGEPPIKTGFPVVDTATGIIAALAIVSALRERDQTGRGRSIDVPMSDAALQLMYTFTCDAMTNGEIPPRTGNQGHSGSPGTDTFQTADGWIALSAMTARQLFALLRALDLDQMAADKSMFGLPLTRDSPIEFAQAKDPARLTQILANALRKRSTVEVESLCTANSIPAAAVRDIVGFVREATRAKQLNVTELEGWGLKILTPGLGFRVQGSSV